MDTHDNRKGVVRNRAINQNIPSERKNRCKRGTSQFDLPLLKEQEKKKKKSKSSFKSISSILILRRSLGNDSSTNVMENSGLLK